MSESIGYYYEVTDEQIREHQSRNLLEILQWHYETNIFLNAVRTPEEKERAKEIKAKNYVTIEHIRTLNFKP